jgi:hypothetical protein
MLRIRRERRQAEAPLEAGRRPEETLRHADRRSGTVMSDAKITAIAGRILKDIERAIAARDYGAAEQLAHLKEVQKAIRHA